MNIKNTIARGLNKADRTIGRTVNIVKNIATRGFEELPMVIREMKYRLKFVKTLQKLRKITPGTLEALIAVQDGLQIGMNRGIITTHFWFIDELREELKDSPAAIIEIGKLKSMLNLENCENSPMFDSLRCCNVDLKQPIYITADNVIVDGNHRYIRALQLGVTTLPVKYVTAPHLELLNSDLSSKLGIHF